MSEFVAAAGSTGKNRNPLMSLATGIAVETAKPLMSHNGNYGKRFEVLAKSLAGRANIAE